jgi:hypothetical protein
MDAFTQTFTPTSEISFPVDTEASNSGGDYYWSYCVVA